MRYLGYILILAVFAAGFFSVHILAALAGALLATVIYAADRRKAFKAQLQASAAPNMILDGAFLFGGQILIMFVVYILGWFFANIGTTSGMLGRTIGAFVAIAIVSVFISFLRLMIEKYNLPSWGAGVIWSVITASFILVVGDLIARMFGTNILALMRF